jgi:hypothetical protein
MMPWKKESKNYMKECRGSRKKDIVRGLKDGRVATSVMVDISEAENNIYLRSILAK